MPSNSLTLTPIEGEPRIHDLQLAERLGFDRPRKIRDIIKRNQVKLLKFGGCPTVGRCIEVGNGCKRTHNLRRNGHIICGAIYVSNRNQTPAASGIQGIF